MQELRRLSRDMKQMRQKVLSILLFVCLILIAVPSNGYAQTSSKEKPDLQISSARELLEFANKVNYGNDYAGKLIKLTKDIKFDETTANNFTSIGTTYKGFRGTFDGAGHTISGIDVTPLSPSVHTGLFGTIGSNGVVKNTTISNSIFNGIYIYSNGSIAGINEGKIDNCHVVNVNVNGGTKAGGITGSNSGTIENCSSNADVKTADASSSLLARIGGITGENKGIINNSCNRGNVFYGGTYECYAGGIAGENTSTATIQNCYYVGAVTAAVIKTSGGIAGVSGGIVANSYCSQESAQVNISVMNGIEKNNKAFPLTEMSTDSFVKLLNANKGDHATWLSWELKSDYPSLVKQNEVTFQAAKNGSVKTNHSYAGKGQVVTLSAVPNKTYKVSKVVVKTGQKTVKVTIKNGTYKFVMPDKKVVITATFVKSR